MGQNGVFFRSQKPPSRARIVAKISPASFQPEKTLLSTSRKNFFPRPQKSAPVLPLIKKIGLFLGVRARKCGGVKGSPRHHFEAQKTTRKMVPKLLTKTPASSSSAYPKMAIFAQIHFPAQPRIWPIWALRSQNRGKLSPSSSMRGRQ